MSRDIAYEIRDLESDSNNEHDMLEQTRRLIRLLQELFAEFPEVVERLDEDAAQLEDLAQKKQFSNLITPLRTLCREAANAAEVTPSQADKQGLRIISSAPGLLTNAERGGAPASLYCSGEG